MRPLVIIPARGGSKGLPGKNIKILNGKPLIHYAIESAMELFDERYICISTDDLEIKRCVEKLMKVPFIRPRDLAKDQSSTYDVVLHALKHYNNLGYFPDVIILLQPTSPFRNSTHIKEALALYNNKLDMVVYVKETRSNPYYVLFEEDANSLLVKSKPSNFVRRQDCPKVWEYNGAIYIINPNSLKNTQISNFSRVQKYVMSEMSSVDIDTAIDWELAELLSKKPNKDLL